MPAVVFVLLSVACAGNLTTSPNVQDGDAQTKLSPEEYKKLSLQLFTDKVQPVIATLKCPACHAQVVGQSPFFADSSADLAFPAIESKVNLNDIESSSLLVRINDEHNCSVAGCEADAQKLLEALNAWQEGLNSAGAGGKQHDFETTRLFPNTDAITNYDIGKLIDEQYAEQFSLQISMEQKGAPNSYQLNDLNITTNDGNQGVFIKGIKILVNGSISDKGTSQILKDIACAVRFTQSLNESVTTIVLDKAKDKLSFAFEEIRLATDDDPDCYSDRAMQRKFDNEIKEILVDNCGGCHAPNETNTQQQNAPQFISFAEVKKRNLLFEAYLINQKENHPGNSNIDNLSDDERNKILSWLRRLPDERK